MTDRNTSPSDGSRPSNGKLVRVDAVVPEVRGAYGAGSPYTGNDAADAGNFDINYRQYLRMIIRRKWLILALTMAILALGSARTLMTTPLYTSTIRLQIDQVTSKLSDNGAVTPNDSDSTEFLRTQYELLQSRGLAERVASSLKLGKDKDFFRPREFSFLGYAISLLRPPKPDTSVNNSTALEEAAAGVILGNRSVHPVINSRLVDITYSDPDPGRAQRVASAYADAFMAANLDKRFQANAFAKTFLEDQIKQLKMRLEDSEHVLLDFAQKEQIVAVTEKSSIAEDNLSAANTALGNLISERIKNEQLWKQVDSSKATSLPQFLTNAVIEDLRAKRNVLVTEYKEKASTYKAEYPAMVEISNKVKEIDHQLATEVQTIRASLKAAYDSSLNQEAETKTRIEGLRGEVLDLQKRSIQYNILKREVDTNRELYNSLLQRFKEVDIAGGVGANNVFVVEKAELPGGPSSPQLMRAMTFAFAVGLGVALAVAYVLEQLDNTVKSAEDSERVSGLSTLGIIPRISGSKSMEQEFADPRSALAEAYRSFCTALQFSTEHGLPKTLLVTSSSPSEGKSVTALAVAKHFSMLGMKVLLVDADLRRPSMHTKLGLENSFGLSNYLAGACEPPDAMQKTIYPNLAFMASGPLPPNAADLLANSRMHSLLSIGLEVFNLIVIDGPPVMGLADSPILATISSATVFVVASGEAKPGQIRGALKRLHLGRAPLIGVVLTKFDAKATGYGYVDGYGYGTSGYVYGRETVTDTSVATRAD